MCSGKWSLLVYWPALLVPQLRLYNLRAPGFQVRYYTQASPHPDDSPLGVTPVISFAQGPGEPTQVHLALTGTPGEMRVIWVSGTQAPAQVRFGVSAGDLAFTASGTSHTYNRTALCHSPQVRVARDSSRW